MVIIRYTIGMDSTHSGWFVKQFFIQKITFVLDYKNGRFLEASLDENPNLRRHSLLCRLFLIH